MSIHLTTKALVLREVAYKETDKILTVLTEAEGKLTVKARGCRRVNSSLAAASQLLSWSEMTLYDLRGQWLLHEAAEERQFEHVRADLEKLSLASYFAEVIAVLAGEGQPEPELLSLILNSLYALDQLACPLLLVKAAFEWKAMAVAGYAPLTECCAVCGRTEPLDPRLDLREGTIRCAVCAGPAGEAGTLPLSSSALSALRHIVEGNPKRLFSFRLDEQSLLQLSDASETYLKYHLDRGFQTLDFCKNLYSQAELPDGRGIFSPDEVPDL